MADVAVAAPGDDLAPQVLKSVLLSPDEYNVKHPLQYSWTLWYDSPSKKMTQTNWSQNLKKLVSFDTVEDFWGVYNNIIKASDLTAGSNYHFFKTGVQPMWEDPANAKGGKWTLNVPRTRKSELDLFWLYTMLGLIGETLEDSDEITGAVVSVRARADRIAIWTKTAGDKEVQEKIARAWKAELSLDDNEMLGYLPHSEASSKAPKDAYTV